MSEKERPGVAAGPITENLGGGPRQEQSTASAPLTALDTAGAALLDKAAAQRLTSRIKLLTGSVRESLDKLAGLVAEARDGQAHVALGYRSWTEYVAAEFGETPLRLDREDRRELVASLAEAGMPTRAIAPVVGVSHETVASDVREAPVRNLTPVREVSGRDGKTYTVPRLEPPKPRRRPLPDQYRLAVHDLQKAVERLERLHADDRFKANQEGLATRHQAWMGEAAGRMQELVRHLMGTDDELGQWRDRGRARYTSTAQGEEVPR